MLKKVFAFLICIMLISAGSYFAVLAEDATSVKVSCNAEDRTVSVLGTARGWTVITIAPEEFNPEQTTEGVLPTLVEQIYCGGLLSYSVVLPDDAAVGKYIVYVTSESGKDEQNFILIDVNETAIIAELLASQRANNEKTFAETVASNTYRLGIDSDETLYQENSAKIIRMLFRSEFKNISDFSALYGKYLALCVINSVQSDKLEAELTKYGADLSIDFTTDIANDKRLTEPIKNELYRLLTAYDYYAELNSGNINFPKILNESKALAAVRCATTWSEIKNVILTSFSDVFSDIADGTEYEIISDKNSVFKNMKQKTYQSLDEIYAGFAEAVQNVYNNEKKLGSGSSSGSSSGRDGTYSVPISDAPDVLDGQTTSSLFRDLDEEHWASDAVRVLAGRNIISGFPDGSFQGERNITRAEFTKLVIVFVNTDNIATDTEETVFSDVGEDDWYKDTVYAAAKYSIITGNEGKFLPNETITREDAAVIVYRIMKRNGNAPLATKYFADRDVISDYAREAVESLGSLDIVSGRGNNEFVPLGHITRYEASQLIFNAFLKGEN